MNDIIAVRRTGRTWGIFCGDELVEGGFFRLGAAEAAAREYAKPSPDTDPPDDYDPLNEIDRDGGQMEDANDEAYDRWAGRYDDLNGGPENDDDR